MPLPSVVPLFDASPCGAVVRRLVVTARARLDVAQQHRCQQCQDERDSRADDGRHVHAVRERLPGDGEQFVARPAAELLGRRHRATERLVRRLGVDARRHGALDLAAVDAEADAAEDRDAQSRAQLGARLGDGRCRTGALRRSRADHQVRAEGGHRAQTGTHDRRRRHQDAEPGGRADQREHSQSDRRDDQAARDDVTGTDLRRECRGRHGTDHQTGRVGQRPEAGGQRGESVYELEVLEREELRTRHHQNADGEQTRRGAEGALPEELEVEQRVGERALAADEGVPDGQTQQYEGDRLKTEAVLGDQFEAVDHGQDGDQRHHRAAEVQPARLLVTVLRQQNGTEYEQDHHDGDADQESRAPPEVVQQESAEQRSEGATHREAGHPHTDGDGALRGVVEHVADQGQRRGHQGRARDTEQCPGHDQHLGAVGERGECRGDAEGGGAGHQQLAPPDPVTEGAHGDEQAGDQESVDVHDPQQLRRAGPQVRCQ